MTEGRFAEESELDFVVVSFRHDDEAARGVGVALRVGVVALDFGWEDALEKKPRMLCCFAVDEESVLLLPLFFAVEGVFGVFAGVRAGALDLSPILMCTESMGKRWHGNSKCRHQAPTEIPKTEV